MTDRKFGSQSLVRLVCAALRLDHTSYVRTATGCWKGKAVETGRAESSTEVIRKMNYSVLLVRLGDSVLLPHSLFSNECGEICTMTSLSMTAGAAIGKCELYETLLACET